MTELPPLQRDEAGPRRQPWLGYLMVLSAAVLFAVNGVVSKVILASGLSSMRLTEVRITGAAIGLVLGLLLVRPASLHVKRRELPFLALFGIGGLALVQWLYFLAIHRLEIGIALLIQYLAPLLVALWARFVVHQQVRRRLWLALVLALTGLTLVVQIWRGTATGLDGLGVAASLAAAVAFAAYILLAEHGVKTRDAVSLTAYGFVFGAVFFALIQPWWSFPGQLVTERVSLLGNLASSHLPVWALMLWMVVLGAIVPFVLFVSALRHIAATRASILAMLEPVVATAVAWAWLDESLGAVQIAGGAIVLAGIVLAQTARD
ncbi:MAG TPA: EamA family transporter [Gaiellaceae bacterium]